MLSVRATPNLLGHIGHQIAYWLSRQCTAQPPASGGWCFYNPEDPSAYRYSKHQKGGYFGQHACPCRLQSKVKGLWGMWGIWGMELHSLLHAYAL